MDQDFTSIPDLIRRHAAHLPATQRMCAETPVARRSWRPIFDLNFRPEPEGIP
jgi:hypothetical protein